jgi:hypothetical protein
LVGIPSSVFLFLSITLTLSIYNKQSSGPGPVGPGPPDNPRKSSDPSINGHLLYPNDVDRSLMILKKNRKYHSDLIDQYDFKEVSTSSPSQSTQELGLD